MKNLDVLNIVVIGAPHVGKTSLIRNFNGEPFLEKTIPSDKYYIDFENSHKDVVSSQGWPLHLKIIDIGGSESFRIHKSPVVIRSPAIIICYDVTDSKSWMGALRRLDDSLSNKCTQIYFCGTKIDLVDDVNLRKISIEEVNSIAKLSRSKVFETSAKDQNSAKELFNTIIDEYVERLPAYTTSKNSFRSRVANFFQR